MKTRKLTLCAFAAIAALGTACNNDELVSTDTPKEGIVIEATASTPKGGTDTRLEYEYAAGVMRITWAAGDNFTAYASATNRTSYDIVPKDAGSRSASFTGTWGTAPSGNVYAIYPSNSTSAPAAIPLSLEGQSGSLVDLKSYNYMTANATYESGKSLNFSFTHQVAIVKLALTFPDGVTGDASNIGLQATGLNKSTQLDLTTVTFSNQVAGDVTTSSAITITNKQLTAYLCVFPGALTDVKAIAKVGNDDYEVDLSDLVIAAGSMYTAAVEMKKKASGIEWAAGNLVADGLGGAKIGGPTDGGLYFQFGSLVGWAGGATGDGTGTAVDGLASVIKVKPSNLNPDNEAWAATGKIWQGTTGTVPFTVKDSGSDDEKAGIGDPCRYYLGDTWRLPTKDEYVALFKDGGYPSGTWKWENSSATNNTLNLTFSASGARIGNSGDLMVAGMYGFYWSASPYDARDGYILNFDGALVKSSFSNNRTNCFPVRCVQSK